MRGSYGPAGGAVARGERLLHIFGLPFALAHELERAHHGAHLIVEERAGGGGNLDEVARARDAQVIEGLHG